MPEKLSVEEYFSNPGTGIMVAPHQTAQSVINRFDKPDALMIFTEPLGGHHIVIRTIDLPWFERRKKAVTIVFERFNITSNDDIDRMSVKQVRQMADMIEKEMKLELQ